jgi:hypothetical protein
MVDTLKAVPVLGAAFFVVQLGVIMPEKTYGVWGNAPSL